MTEYVDRTAASDAEFEAMAAKFEAAPVLPESWEGRPTLLMIMDVTGVTPYIERLAGWLARHLPGGVS